MKKLIMFSLAVVAACAVNAASFMWNATANGVDGNGDPVTSSTAANFVLCYLGNSNDSTPPSYDSAAVVQEGTWTIGTSKGVTNAKVGGTYLGDGPGGLANGNVYAVMVKDEAGGLHQIAGTSTYTVTGYTPGDDTWAGSDFVFATSNFVADKASYGAEPEPTSGLLMLVGLGILGLRRKRK